jgi:probable F420-dependent oxidoreductase
VTLFRTVDAPPAVALFALNMAPTVGPAELAGIAVLAEDLGYESLWVGEHPPLPDPAGSASPFPPDLELVDPIVHLSYLAGVTSRIRLGTGIVILPLRNPVVLAKQLASLDVLSGGRLMFGYGVGYIEPTFRAVGVPYRRRLARALEHVSAMRSLWHDEKPEFHGEFVDFDHIAAHPRPVQAPLPVITGGHAPAALRGAVTHSHGWYGFGLPPATVAWMKEGLRREADLHGRPDELGPLGVTVTPPRGALRPEMVGEYQKVGAERLVLFPPDGIDLAGLTDYVRAHAPGKIGATAFTG